MKVNILTDVDIDIKRFHWWSKWIDVAIYDYSCEPFLIQMKVSKSNKKKFRSVKINGFRYRQVNSAVIGDLTQMQNEQPLQQSDK